MPSVRREWPLLRFILVGKLNRAPMILLLPGGQGLTTKPAQLLAHWADSPHMATSNHEFSGICW